MNRASPDPHVSLQGRVILLVEDEPLIVADVTRALEREGARVLGAASVDRGLAWLDAHPVDGAVLDLRLGRGESCRPVIERLVAEGVPFLVHTGDAGRQTTLLDTLDVPVLSKPCPSHELAARIARLVAGGEHPGGP